MLFVVLCTDKPGCLDLRKAVRSEHLAYLKKCEQYIKIVGPLTDNDGNSCGSLIMIDVENRLAAESVAAGDPYAKAGLFESVIIRPFKMVGYEGKIL